MTEEESSKRLQQLLRLKRHESPPPGYFREFSGGVLDRIRAAEAERAASGWRRWWFRSPRPIGSEGQSKANPDPASWPAWGWNIAGLAAMATLIGGLYWASQIAETDVDAPAATDRARQASVLRVASPGSPAESGSMLAGASVGAASAWTASDAIRTHGLRPGVSSVDSAFRLPVTVSMSGTPPEVSSTNPFPVGLFRLPGASGGGAEAYRVRFGEGPR